MKASRSSSRSGFSPHGGFRTFQCMTRPCTAAMSKPCGLRTAVHRLSRRHITNLFSFGKGNPQEGKNSHLHMFMLKDGNRNMQNSPLAAISDYDGALELEETAEALCKRSFAYFYIKDYKQATADYERALKLNPRCVEAYCAGACIQIAQEEHTKAIELLSTALDLTSPIDFRRSSIEEVMNGCKVSMRGGMDSSKTLERLRIGQQIEHPQEDLFGASAEQLQHEHRQQQQIHAKSTSAEAVASQSGAAMATAEVVQGDVPSEDSIAQANAAGMADVPFDRPEFLELQTDITKQMIDIGGEEFQAKLAKLNEIPAVAKFQAKTLRGEKPSYSDYTELMKDRKFARYNEIMTEIAKDERFAEVTKKFAAMDWMGAYGELKKDPDALKLYMKAFDELDKD